MRVKLSPFDGEESKEKKLLLFVLEISDFQMSRKKRQINEI